MRPAPDSKLLEKHLLQENIDLSDSLKAREVEIEKIKSDIKKLHKDEEEKLGTLPDAPIDTLDAIWARFFDKYSY